MSVNILVTGATGCLGTLLRAELQNMGVPYRALVRKSEQADALSGPGAEAVVGDMTDPNTLTPAFEGIKRAFLLTPGMPFHPQAVQMGKNFTEAAKAAGVEHIVVQSMYGLENNPDQIRVLLDHAETQETLKASGIPFTTLGSNYSMQALAAQGMLQTAKHAGTITHSLDAPTSYVDFADVATVAAKCLTEDGHAGKFYKLTGPEELTANDVAAAFGEVLGKEVTCVHPTEEQTRTRLAGFGMPGFMIDAVIKLGASNRTGRLGGVSPTLKAIIGREPATLRDFATRSLA